VFAQAVEDGPNHDTREGNRGSLPKHHPSQH
jgi:hypothetical protein